MRFPLLQHFLFILAAAGLAIGCSGEDEGNIASTASADPRLTTLVTALENADLVDTLAGPGTFTVLAPTNQAFTDAGIDLASLSADELRPILLYHVIAGEQYASDFAAGTVETLSGQGLTVSVDDGVVFNGSARVIDADIRAGNGVIHVIDTVLIPPAPSIVELAASREDLSTLVAAIERADLVTTLEGEGPFTVLAPTNDAFNDLLQELGSTSLEDLPVTDLTNILLYHVFPAAISAADLFPGYVPTANRSIAVRVAIDDAGDVLFDEASPLQTDLQASNGWVHVVDRVLTPVTQTIVELAVGAAPEFENLVSALQKTGLDKALSADGPFTVFAPTDAAFDAISSTTATLTVTELTDILKYHVVPGRIFSSDLATGTVETLLTGETLTIDVDALTVNSAQLIGNSLDIQGTNGVIHAIDKVLIP